eukprot:5781886-Prymnesium_polylepis.1
MQLPAAVEFAMRHMTAHGAISAISPLLMIPPPSGMSAAKAAEVAERRGALVRTLLDTLGGEAGKLGKMSVNAPEVYAEVARPRHDST